MGHPICVCVGDCWEPSIDLPAVVGHPNDNEGYASRFFSRTKTQDVGTEFHC